MGTRNLSKDELKELIRDSMREVIREERLSLCEIMIPIVARKEMDEIHVKFGSPEQYQKDDFTDMTDWVNG